MEFEWDAAKAASNFAKHGVRFETAAYVWDDPFVHFIDDWIVDGEERVWAIGRVSSSGLLVVVHIQVEDDLVRVISARKAVRREKILYQEQAS